MMFPQQDSAGSTLRAVLAPRGHTGLDCPSSRKKHLASKWPTSVKREPDLEAPVFHPAHGDVEPVPAEGGLLTVDVADDLGARDPRVTDVGADPGRSRHLRGEVEGEGDQVAAEEDAAASGGRLLDQAIGLLHGSSISSISQIAFGKKRGRPFPLAKSIKFAKVKC